MSEEVKPFYKTPSDLIFYFRDKDSIESVFRYVMSECNLFADEIDRSGNQIPYPIVIDDRSQLLQIDYQFLIHCVAKYVSIKTKERVNYKKIIKAFALLPSTFKNPIAISNRKFFIFILESMNRIVNLGNYKAKMQFSSVCAPKLLNFKDIYVDFKAVTITNSNNNEIQNMGLTQYIGEDLFTFRKRYIDNFNKNKVEQVAFLAKNISVYCKENEVKKHTYFNIDETDLNDYIDYKIVSNLIDETVEN